MTTEIENFPIEEEIEQLFEQGDTEGVKALLAPLHPGDITELLEDLEEDKVVGVFTLLSNEVAAAVLPDLEDRQREQILAATNAEKLVELIDEMPTDDATDIVSELPSDDARQVLDGLDTEESLELQKLLEYPEDTAGGKMQTELVSVREDSTVRETIAEIRKRGHEIEQFTSVFVVDGAGKLLGTVSLDRLIMAEEHTPVKDITETEPVTVTTDIDQEEVGRIFQRYDRLSMPVVDDQGCLVGRITIDDVVDVIEEEIFEDFYKMASLNKGEGVLDPPMRSFKLRSPWLLVNLGTAFLAASVVKLFESTIESLVILAVFMPIVAGVGGNAATQTITVIVRGLALGDLDLRDARKILAKEGAVGFANGILIGLAAGVIAYLFGANIMIGVLLFCAMTANLIIAGLSGAVIPLALKWVGVDPALSSSVFVTTCTDIGGFFTFLGLATVFIKMGLL